MVNHSIKCIYCKSVQVLNNYYFLGSPCAKQNNRCMHGLCEEIKHGEDFLCHCDKGFTGDNLFIYIKYDILFI